MACSGPGRGECILPKKPVKAQSRGADNGYMIMPLFRRPQFAHALTLSCFRRHESAGSTKTVQADAGVVHWLSVWLLLTVVALCCCRPTMAVDYEADLGDSQWLVQASIFECQLIHDVPFYGDAVFYQQAGDSQKFQIKSHTPRLQTGQAALQARSPMWKPKGRNKDLGYIDVVRGERPINLDTRMSQRILSELHQGMEVVFTRRPWYGAEKSTQVKLSSVNFRPAYQQYLDCLANLLPVNFEQIERTAIYFGSDKEALLPSEVKKMDNIGVYYRADPSITAFYVDGHTDSVGSRQENFELSRDRAEMVVKFLTSRGIPEEKITTRWHGERYPVASNQTRVGRAQNRRVTIRLVRGDKEEPINPETQVPSEEDDN